jgi:uncharacterized OB-fold protein
MSNNNKLIQQGWECPKCGSVYSPITIKCVVCPQGVSITSGRSQGVSITSGTETSSSGTTFICSGFLGEGGTSITAPRCMKCGKQQSQHPIISSTL